MKDLTPDDGGRRNHQQDGGPNSGQGSWHQILGKISTFLNQGGEGEDVSVNVGKTTDSVQMVHIKRTPSGDASSAVTEAGDVIVDWKDKFKRERETDSSAPFSPGEKIKIQGTVIKDANGEYVFRADADGRVADNFYLGKAPEGHPLSAHVGLPLTVIVEVGAERKADYRISDIWNYDAKFLEIHSRPLVNPTEEAVAALSTGTRVVVEGAFLGFRGRPSNESSEEYDSGIVRLDDGREVYLDFPTGQINFSGGVHENLRDKAPSVGDRIAIGAFVSREKRHPDYAREGIEAGVRLAAQWCDPCVLRDASQERKSDYQNLRDRIGDNIAQIDSEVEQGNWAGARTLIGQTRKMEALNPELDRIDTLVAKIPENERPVLVPRDQYQGTSAPHFWAAAIDTAYGVTLESMSKPEFVDFMRSAVTGERIQTGKHGDTSYLYMIAKDFGIDPKTCEELLVATLDARLPRVRGVPYDHETHWDDKYNIDSAFKHLAGCATTTSTQRIVDLICEFVEKGEFRKTDWRDDSSQHPETFIFEAANALACALTELPDAALATLRDNLDRIIGARDALQAKGDEPIATGDLTRIINFVEQIQIAE